MHLCYTLIIFKWCACTPREELPETLDFGEKKTFLYEQASIFYYLIFYFAWEQLDCVQSVSNIKHRFEIISFDNLINDGLKFLKFK